MTTSTEARSTDRLALNAKGLTDADIFMLANRLGYHGESLDAAALTVADQRRYAESIQSLRNGTITADQHRATVRALRATHGDARWTSIHNLTICADARNDR